MANALFHGMTVDYSETWYVDQMKEARLGSRAIHMEFIGFMETHGTGSNGGNEFFGDYIMLDKLDTFGYYRDILSRSVLTQHVAHVSTHQTIHFHHWIPCRAFP
jgi:hypothetical protein